MVGHEEIEHHQKHSNYEDKTLYICVQITTFPAFVTKQFNLYSIALHPNE